MPQVTERPLAKTADDEQAVAQLKQAHENIVAQIRKRIVGMEQVIDEMLISIFANGHCLLVGVPGLAKTLLVSSLAESLSLSFKRIQFTPDLMPSDITGTEILQDDPKTGERKFKFLRGPVFANLLLADEINRTPPKNAGGAAGGHAGKEGLDRRRGSSFGGAVLCAGHAKPDRAGRNVSAS